MDELQQLIADCAANKRLSQEKLYRRFYPQLFLLCKRFFSNDHDALQVLNDAMMKVFRHVGSYDSNKGEFFNWMYTIVRNTALDSLKLVKQPPMHELNGQAEKGFEENPLKALEWKDVYKLLDMLPPATRIVCSLFYLEGFSIKEIGEKLQLSTGTVKWHLSETRNKLKPVLKNYYL